MSPERDAYVVRGMMAATLRALRLFGLAPLRFSRVDDGVYLVSPSRSIFIIGILSLFGIQLLLALLYYFQNENGFLNNLGGFESFWILWSASFSSFAVGGGFSRMRGLKILLKQIHKIQSKLECDTSFELKVSTVVLIFSGFLLTNVVYCAMSLAMFYIATFDMEELKIRIYINMIFFFELNFVVLLELQYVFLGFCLYLVVKNINYKMGQNIASFKDPGNTSYDLTNNMKFMYQCYLEICLILSDMNQSEGFMMILILLREVTDIFISVYYVLSTAATSISSSKDLICLFIYILMILYTCMRMVCFVEVGYRLQSEINKTKGLFTEMMWRQSNNVVLERELNNYMYQFLLHQPTLSPLGIVTFSRPLIATIVGAIISFVIIIFQFNLETI